LINTNVPINAGSGTGSSGDNSGNGSLVNTNAPSTPVDPTPGR
jgi:hypothetical protein